MFEILRENGMQSQRTASPQMARMLTLMVPLMLIGACILGVLYWQRRDEGRNPNGEYVVLRSGIFLRIFLPTSPSPSYDAITVTITREAWRDKGGIANTPNTTTSVPLSEPLWQDIRSLQSSWCVQVPKTEHPTQEIAVYKVELACPPIRNPVLYFVPDQLDPRLQALIDASTSDK